MMDASRGLPQENAVLKQDQGGRPVMNYHGACQHQGPSVMMMPMEYQNAMNGGMRQAPIMMGSQQYMNPSIAHQRNQMQNSKSQPEAMGYPGSPFGGERWVGA